MIWNNVADLRESGAFRTTRVWGPGFHAFLSIGHNGFRTCDLSRVKRDRFVSKPARLQVTNVLGNHSCAEGGPLHRSSGMLG